MPISLTDYERGEPFDGDYHAALKALQQRLAHLQVAQVVHRKRTIIIFEGWVAAGKRSALKRLAASWDPCYVTTRASGGLEAGDDERHWLAPYWSALPAAGDTTIFFGSWYRRLIEERLSGRIDDKRWARACDEINEFEAQQRDHGTLVVKLFFHISLEEQVSRLRAWQDDPWYRPLLSPTDLASVGQRERTTELVHDVFAQTDTRWAPWRVIDANDKSAARLATLTALADALTKALPAEPPIYDETVVAFHKQKSA